MRDSTHLSDRSNMITNFGTSPELKERFVIVHTLLIKFVVIVHVMEIPNLKPRLLRLLVSTTSCLKRLWLWGNGIFIPEIWYCNQL